MTCTCRVAISATARIAVREQSNAGALRCAMLSRRQQRFARALANTSASARRKTWRSLPQSDNGGTVVCFCTGGPQKRRAELALLACVRLVLAVPPPRALLTILAACLVSNERSRVCCVLDCLFRKQCAWPLFALASVIGPLAVSCLPPARYREMSPLTLTLLFVC